MDPEACEENRMLELVSSVMYHAEISDDSWMPNLEDFKKAKKDEL